MCKLIHTDIKPENVVIGLTKQELKEIRDKGVLKTTKMYHQDEKHIARAVAGAHDNIILSHRVSNKDRSMKNDMSTSNLDVSKDNSEVSKKDKKKLKNKRKKLVHKYIKQGRLPADYSTLPKEEKDRLFQEVRKQVESSNLK